MRPKSCDGKSVAARFEETDKIAILPEDENVFCGDNPSGQTGYDVLDAVNLPEGHTVIVNKTTWIPEMSLALA